MMDDDFNITDYIRRIRFKPVATTDPDAVYERTLYRIRYEKLRKATIASRRWKHVSVVASLAFAILLSYHLFTAGGDIETVITPPAQVVYMETSALPGTKTCVNLPDGSKVWLNGSASIRYPQPFGDAGRRVELTGEALFDISKGRPAPFVVSAGGMNIEVTGTVFNVCSGLDGGRTEITLIEGSVSLYKPGNETNQADCILEANRQAVYDDESGAISLYDVNASSFSSWVTREFIFEKTSMEDIARELGRAFGVNIHIANDDVGKMQLSGRFTHRESLDKILSILRIPADYAYVREEDGEIYIR
ncbi:MAG: FecR domain-containing protein [Tannerellaceae bacterium]|jgi:ferric-dicitrate binding protein FerR (iron transport regulator)|nr:FecR domain-containing protein [Tannerellaceae bacterium]